MLKDSHFTYITDLGLCRPANVKSSQEEYNSDYSEIEKQAEEADKINEKFTSTSLPYNEPKNAVDNKDNDNSIGEYSESIEAIDFTNLNLDNNN
ncbi:unnamed protein product [Rhizophagus irregularis]|nr:unnamed protein product [Rhizophagus irregularis]